jgi:uncharacterized protein
MHSIELENTPRRPRRLAGVLVPVFLLVVGLPFLAHLYIDHRWFASVGHAEVFRRVLGTKLVLGSLYGACAGLLLLANLRLAVRLSEGLTPQFLYDAEGIPRIDLGRLAKRLTLPASAVAAVLVGMLYDRHWVQWQLFANAGDFGEHDPIFGRDIGFYVFRLPFYETLTTFALGVVAVSAVAAAALYMVRGAIATGPGVPQIHPAARSHLSVLIAIVFLLLALRGYLQTFDVLFTKVGPMTGASYADVHARLPALYVQIAIAAVCAVLVLASIGRANFNFAILAAGLFIVAQLGTRLYPEFVHRFSVKPNELARENPYLKHNIDATRRAYGLEDVVERELSARYTLTPQDVAKNHDTLDNVRLWDHQMLLETFSQIQEIRTYYDFTAVDNDRYMIDGKLRQVMLSARELNTGSLPNPTWINRSFMFTHGYGLTLGPVNEVTPEGLPVLFVQDIPPRSNKPDIKVTRPAIYFGELSSDHVFVRTRNREFHYPSGEGNVQTDYDGKDGIRFDSALMRIALALELGSIELLLSNDIDSNSRVLLHRNIQQRFQRVAPFLALDSDPYLVVRKDGTLVWICDAYTVTDRYPYSEPMRQGGLNYIRNSVKAVIDAYHGTVTLYALDERDPILATLRRAFPQSFSPISEMPADIRAHLRYPQLIFNIQTQMFSTYHMRDADLLYNREDQWEVPSLGGAEKRLAMEPYYTVMKLPEEKRAEFILMLPFTPKRKDNLAAWMVARSDGAHLGQLVVYRFPKDRLVFGPQQVINRINQDADISRQISLWDQSGSQALFGTLLVIPIEESLIYVRPLYLRSEGGKIPELKRVIVVHEKQIAMEPTLRESVEAIFGAPESEGTAAIAPHSRQPETVSLPATGEPSSALQLAGPHLGRAKAAEALQHFERAISAQRAGDWARYGAELESVEQVLRQMAPQADVAKPSRPDVTATRQAQ